MSSRAADLHAVLDGMGEVAIAVSGGVDSMTLAVVAHRTLGPEVTMVHAVSPAVPPEATERIGTYASREGWCLEVIDAGEFGDERYLANPANRCFFCKTNLYATIAARTRGTILSGTNLDDLGDWRPGLQAATDHGVRHPYVEAGLDKAAVRALARALRLDDLAELPAAPCLSSRLETGVGVTAERLRLVHEVERLIGRELAPRTVRCRMLRDGIAIQLDPDGLARISGPEGEGLKKAVRRVLFEHGRTEPLRFEPYRMGSAFHRPGDHGG